MVKEVIKVKDNISLDSITHQQIEIQIIEKLQRVLENIPILSNVDVSNARRNEFDIEAHANIGEQKKLHIICEIKKKAEPLHIRNAVNQLKKYKMMLEQEYDNDFYCMIAAPYISQASSRIFEEEEMGYIDLSGNCLIKHHSIYVRVEGNPNSYSEKRGSKSIYERSSIRSSIILRNLLQNPRKKWKVQELADISSSSIGQVSKVKKFLEEREFITSSKNGFSINKPKEVIAEWAKVYNSKSNTVYECYSLDSIPQIEQKLIDMNDAKGIESFLTCFAGAVRYAPTVRYNKVHVYIPLQDLQEAIMFLGCKKVSSGSNISIIVPYDQSVLYDVRMIKSSMVVSPVQTCLDLMMLKGRGEEAATAVLEKEFTSNER